MNIELRKFNLIRDLMKIKDEQMLDTVETLLEGVIYSQKTPRQDSATDLPTPDLKRQRIRKKKYLYTLDELLEENRK